MNIELAYNNYRNELIKYSERIVYHREVAEDICQESYIVLLFEAQKQHIKSPRSYLFKVARNFAYDYLRHKKIVENYSQLFDTSVFELPSAEQLATNDQYADIIRQVIEELPERRRMAFILHKINGFSYAEIAQTLAISESGVEKHLMKANAYCRQRLNERLA
ncbi:MAG: RNA polymerase sigma factor [Methylococcaceae bacterium]|nr:RNA polymerase sigma factor [Methylococcaceae bacterium]